MSGMLPVQEISSSVYESWLDPWENPAIVPQKRRFSQLEELSLENEFDSREERMGIQHYPSPQIQRNGMGYSSLGEMSNFYLALPGEASREERIDDAAASIFNRSRFSQLAQQAFENERDWGERRPIQNYPLPQMESNGVWDSFLGQEDAQSMQLIERSNPFDDSRIKKRMSEIDYAKFSKILTIENRTEFLCFSQQVKPSRDVTEMTPKLLVKFLYFLVFTRNLTREKAYDYLEIWARYYGNRYKKKYVQSTLQEFTKRCNGWEYKHYPTNDPSISPSNCRFTSACYLVFIAVNMLWVFEAIAPKDELLNEKDRKGLIDHFTSSSENFDHFRGYWQKAYKEDLMYFAENGNSSWKVEGSFQEEMKLLKEQFRELANRENRDEDRLRLSEICNKLIWVTGALQLPSITGMLKGWRIHVKRRA
jgi:hypothetical protein